MNMNKNVIFSICAKNYLAQAITLRESVIKNNPSVDFYLFLSDSTDSTIELDFLVELDDKWIESWKRMAFKYNVIEFSTSIKPYCFNKLFSQGYDKVIYLDPDIYVTADLQPIYDMLNNKSIVLSPHYCNIQTNYTGAVTEEELLFVGIYNLGFAAIKNDLTGNKIITWWMNRLHNKCYADHDDALHVDQKWMDFVPCFFPNETLITHHMGINPAIWNLHERELFINDLNEYKIRDSSSKQEFSLLFFHFSGFDPFNPTLLNRRHPRFGIKQFPSFKPLIDEYVEQIYNNKYDYYSKQKFNFNSFSNGEHISPLNRRLFRLLENKFLSTDPFDVYGEVYLFFKVNNILTGVISSDFKISSKKDVQNKSKYIMLLTSLLKYTKMIIGTKYYLSLLINLRLLTRLESQEFLIKNIDNLKLKS